MTRIKEFIKINKKLIAISLLFFIFCTLVSLVMTWKLGTRMGSYYFSPEVPGDGMGTIALNWYNEYAGKNNLPEPVTDFFAYPFGYDRRGAPVYPFTTGLMNQLTRIIGSQAAYNILIFLSFPAAALAMFLLIFYLTRSLGGAIAGGFFYGFSPWLTARAFDHVSLCGVYILPLFVLAAINFSKKKNASSATLVAIALVTAAYTDIHLAMFCVFLGLVWAFTVLLKKRSEKPEEDKEKWTWSLKNLRLRLALMIILIIAVSAAAYAPFFMDILYKDPTVFPEENTRGIQADIDFAAEAWNYIVPSVYSTLWGKYSEDFVLSRLGKRTSNEVTSYLGLVTIVLALTCLYLSGKKTRIYRKYGSKVENIKTPVTNEKQGKVLNTAINFSVLSIVLAFLFSLSPLVSIGSVEIPTPSILISGTVPFFRYFCRWSLVVTFGFCLLAGIGFAFLCKRLRLDRRGIAILCFFAIALFIIDTTIVPPLRSKYIRQVPETIKELAKSPKSEPVCIYPLAQGYEYTTLHYLFLQQFHLHPMLNGIKASTEADLYRLTLKDIYSPYTPRMLKALGIQKAVILKDYYGNKDYGNYPFGIPFNPEQMPDGYTLVEETADGFIYEIDAEPAGVFPLFYANFTPPAILEDGRSWTAMTGQTGEIKLVRKSDDITYSFSIVLNNPGDAGDLTIRLDGRTVGKQRLENGTTVLTIPEIKINKESEMLDLEWSGNPVNINGTSFRASGDINIFLLLSAPELNEITTGAQ